MRGGLARARSRMVQEAYRGVILVLLAGASACAPKEPSRGDLPGEAPRPAILSSSPPASASVTAASANVAPAKPPSASSPPELIEGMALVPAGPFTMGADDIGEMDERPAHTVTLPAYYLDLTEVTNEAYGRCVSAGVCLPSDPKNAEVNRFGHDSRFRAPKQPVSSITWDSARAYCIWAGKRLPTEAEWEKAARGTDGRRFPWGNKEPTREHAVFAGGVTAVVGSHPKGDGPYGHHDMAGNVWEWLEDIYDPMAYSRSSADKGIPGSCPEVMQSLEELRSRRKQGYTGTNPIPTECERVLRGGAFNYPAPGLRSSNRVHHPARYHLVMSGVRCALDAR
jgi:formylglycine-generating enzyme required for sulfatase activity